MSHALAAPRLAPASSRSSGPSSPCCCVVAASATRSARVVAGSGVNPRRGRGLVSARAVADPSPAAAAAAPAAALPPLPPLNGALGVLGGGCGAATHHRGAARDLDRRLTRRRSLIRSSHPLDRT